jgi:hypothetical protein
MRAVAFEGRRLKSAVILSEGHSPRRTTEVEAPSVAFYRIFLWILFCFAVSGLAQSPSTPSAPDQPQSHGTVIFSRSTDENGQTTTAAGPAATQVGGQSVTAPTATDAEREAVTFTDFDLDVHIHPAAHQIAVRAAVTVRNDGIAALAHIPLQISSSLTWERIRVAGRDTPFTVATLNSDVDHTGQLHEAAVPVAAPLAPGATLQLDVTYSGTVLQSAQRLLAIGTPNDVALHSDWDQIDGDFTGLRGFGNVVWYPASAIPVILGDGARVFDEMGEHKLRMAGAHFRLRLAAEFPHGHAPTVALINGHPVPLTVTDSPAEGDEVAGLATASLDSATIGFEAPSLFLAARTTRQAANTTLFTLPEDLPAVEDWSASISAVTPFLQGWLGQSPRSQLTILDLPDPEDAPFETGSLLVAAVRQATSEQLDGLLAHALTHAWLRTSEESPPAWLDEGVAHFMDTLWLEKQSGRQKALESLESGRPALALVEPPSPGESAGQPLAQAISPVYYRTKATYVFWMLRDLVGDAALSAALRAYDPAAHAARRLGENPGVPSDGTSLLGRSSSSGTFETLLEHVGTHRDLSWFFADWVDADKGLPDIAIDSVFPAPAQSGTWLVAINLSNSGYAAAEVPVTLSTTETSVTQRVLVPARGKAVQRILIQGKPTQVQANDGTVPETEASVHIKTLIDAGGSSSPSAQPTAPPQ